MISNHYNQIEDFQRNDVILPEYHPKMSSTDFNDDRHMFYLHKYLKFIQSVETTVGFDVRSRIEAAKYETFIQKMTKSVRYDSYSYSNASRPEF